MKWDMFPVQEDHKARFYEDYHKVAEEYDREFMKKYDEDLNTTLIFVGHAWRCNDRKLIIRMTGWSILGCYICIHNRGRLSIAA